MNNFDEEDDDSKWRECFMCNGSGVSEDGMMLCKLCGGEGEIPFIDDEGEGEDPDYYENYYEKFGYFD